MYRSTIAVLVLCALSICILAHHGPPPHVRAAMKKCIEELGGDESTMEMLRHHEELDAKFKCIDACIMKELNNVNDDGTFSKEKAIEGIPSDAPHREALIEAINNCSSEKGADECETAQLIRKCMMEKMPKKRPE